MSEPRDAHRQIGYHLRMEWGLTGATAISAGCDIAVVVDVLSFTTALSVAADRGIVVFPYPWRDERAESFAADHDATLAVGRSMALPSQVSLSPASIRTAPDSLRRLVLPSPNGSTISFRLAGTVSQVIGASLRNRRSVADWLLTRHRENPDLVVAIIAAGERWPDGTLRPAVEDLWGAGALVESLRAGGWSGISPEAQAAEAAFGSVADDLTAALSDCASGRELLELGYADDVLTAGELDQGRCVPSLQGDAFTPIGPPW
jgi:2-phosphosulfolactate phosphatase